MYTVFWLGNLRERDHLEDPGVDGDRDWIDLDQDKGKVAGFCKSGNEPSVSIKFGEFLDKLITG